MISLKIKIVCLTILILGLAIGLSAWHNLQTQEAIIGQITLQNSRILSDTIRSSIITNMAYGQNSEVANILAKISKEPTIESVRIFDETGRILMSANPEEIGDLISASELLAYRSGRTSFVDTHPSRLYHSAMAPIANAPPCYGCHEPETQVLGVLNVHLSLRELHSLQRKGREAALLYSTLTLAVLVLAITGFILYYVDTPIRRLVRGMESLERGDFVVAKIEIDSSAEMAQLGGKFNLMVGRLKNLMETTVQHEREMAITQEKLLHHDEVRSMNSTLEERLREIEFLNVTLEERIGEIEEANYKIADLASDLEAKNTTLAQAVSRLSALYKMGLAINSTMDLDQLFGLLLHRSTQALDARIGYILLLEKESWTMRIGAALGLPEEFDEQARVPLRPGSVSHWVVEKNEPLLIRNIAESREFSRISRLGFSRETVICAPLVIKDEVVGTLTMANRHDNLPFTPEDLELLSTIAAQASVAINNAHLYQEQQTTYLSTVQALVSTIEASDAYTRGHSERVTRYCLAIGRQAGLPHMGLRRLEQAAILHDIGKIGIDAALLHKPGELSASEIEILHQHPSIGVRILEPIHFLREVREIIEQHHEHYDGSGYPHRLQGEAILLEARILAVADAYDAMISHRPYRQALTEEEALLELEKHAGSQFDPQIVMVFLCLWRENGLARKTADG
ncbi:MAG: GAF domain-containing protein [Desulfuromonadales bacterium]|nr:GAF domain-containing protein [Desulfuromonadales bacterium]